MRSCLIMCVYVSGFEVSYILNFEHTQKCVIVGVRLGYACYCNRPAINSVMQTNECVARDSGCVVVDQVRKKKNRKFFRLSNTQEG